MVSSYLADMEVYLVWSWEKGAEAYGFYTLGNYLVICPCPGVPSIPRSKTQQQQADKSHTWIPPAFPEVSLAPAFLQEDAGGSKKVGSECDEGTTKWLAHAWFCELLSEFWIFLWAEW